MKFSLWQSSISVTDTFHEKKAEKPWNVNGGVSFEYLDNIKKETYSLYQVIKFNQSSIFQELKQVADEKKRILSNWKKHRDFLTEKREAITQLKQKAFQKLESIKKHQNILNNQQAKIHNFQNRALQVNLCIQETQLAICKDEIQIFEKNILDLDHPLMVGVVEKRKELANLKEELLQNTQLQQLAEDSQWRTVKQQRIWEQLVQSSYSRAQQAELGVKGLEEFLKELEKYVRQLSDRYDSLTIESTSMAIERLKLKEKLQSIHAYRKLKLLEINLWNL